MRRSIAHLVAASSFAGALAAQPPGLAEVAAQLEHSVRQLREHHGAWSVETRFLNPDGSTATVVHGTYRFEWVLRDRILSGVSEIPALKATSGILLYLAEGRGVIEMVSVGAEGTLWTMTGPLGGEERKTAPFAVEQGVLRTLRFTRIPIAPDSFESRMHFTDDGGRTWVPGNHQVFRRVIPGRELR
jgi:hypothetical protein